jgi:diketogulonate reductase-like aldo/keto reductase
MLGLGVFLCKDDEETVNSVKWAIEAGYRHIDTASVYKNEKTVGEGIRQSGINRKDIFVTTKLKVADMKENNQMGAFETSLNLLGLDYIDLYLVHWPAPGKTGESWKVMEEIYKSGRARAIGVSNFTVKHIDELMKIAKVVPAVNQVELHPHHSRADIAARCEKLGIAMEAWSPLGGTGGNLLNDPVLVKIAEKHKKSAAQVIIRWDLQKGTIVIPKSVHKERIIANADVFNFKLSAEEIKTIDDLDLVPQRTGIGWNPDELAF